MFFLGRFLAALLMIIASSQLAAEDFTRASQGYQWSFPRDHGQHTSYESEWWYYTGQLYEQGQIPFRDKPRLGFQLTFFRKAVQASSSVHNEYMAHAAVTDLVAGKTLFESRIGGGALGLAGVAQGSLRGWSGDWSVDPIGDSLFLRFSVADSESSSVRQLRIHVSQTPHPWLQGIGGLSAKSECAGCASMYYTLPRMAVTAQYVNGVDEQAMSGIGWMDHEFMTNSLSPTQIGWDWMGLMLKDGRSVMLFRVRSKDIGAGEYIAGAVRRGEDSRTLAKDDFQLTPVSSWTSPRSRATYPTAWRVQIPSESIDVTISARTRDCEVGVSETGASQSAKGPGITYWEGPVASGDESVLGYLEMTGYAGDISLK